MSQGRVSSTCYKGHSILSAERDRHIQESPCQWPEQDARGQSCSRRNLGRSQALASDPGPAGGSLVPSGSQGSLVPKALPFLSAAGLG